MRIRGLRHLLKHISGGLGDVEVVLVGGCEVSESGLSIVGVVPGLAEVNCRRRKLRVAIGTCIGAHLGRSQRVTILLTVALLVLVEHFLNRERLFVWLMRGIAQGT